MNYLQYTSNEMYSSTDLIRKSKSIFDKLNKKEIEKAIILRDGKPSFMLLDFETYEKIMIEYMQLKNNSLKNNVNNETAKEKELNEDEVRKALEEIDKLDLSINQENTIKEDKPPLKEFWE